MTTTDGIRHTIQESRIRLASERGPEKEVAIMLGALAEAVLMLAETDRSIEFNVDPELLGRGFVETIAMPAAEEMR